MGHRRQLPPRPPRLEPTGAESVADVRPYEDMKLRLLNGSYSSIAYLGQLAGWQTVADAVAAPQLRAHIAALMDEVATTLTLPPSVNLHSYRDALLVRFANPALRHRTAPDRHGRLAETAATPVRASPRAHRRRPAPLPRIALGVAAWLHFLQGRADVGSALTLDDPREPIRLRAAAKKMQEPTLSLFDMPDIVPPALQPFRTEVAEALAQLAIHGARKTLLSMGGK